MTPSFKPSMKSSISPMVWPRLSALVSLVSSEIKASANGTSMSRNSPSSAKDFRLAPRESSASKTCPGVMDVKPLQRSGSESEKSKSGEEGSQEPAVNGSPMPSCTSPKG